MYNYNDFLGLTINMIINQQFATNNLVNQHFTTEGVNLQYFSIFRVPHLVTTLPSLERPMG